jgi:hypothetical protein
LEPVVVVEITTAEPQIILLPVALQYFQALVPLVVALLLRILSL